MNIVFFGTPDFALAFLSALHADEEIFVSAVVCQPDRPVGRKQTLTAPPTKIFAAGNDIPVIQPTSKKDILPLLQETLGDKPIDAFVIVAYGMIIPQDVLDLPKTGSINVHPSLLPAYRGPSPMQAAILNQDEKTGVSIMLIDEEMDHGPILTQEVIKLKGTETPETLSKKVVEIGAPLLVEEVKKHIQGESTPREQNHDQATYCRLIKKEDGRIDWTKPAKSIEARIRAYTPWPGTFTDLEGKRMKVHTGRISELPSTVPGKIHVQEKRLFVSTGSTQLELLEVQPEGKQRMDANAFLNSHQDIQGKTFS